MLYDFTPTELEKVYAALESVLKDLNLDNLHLKSFTLVEPNNSTRLSSSVSILGAKDQPQPSESWKAILTTYKKERKCYERRCEYKHGKLTCKDVQVPCKG